MSKTTTVRARIEPELKDRAESVFHRLGLSATQAITIFYRQVELRGGLPFDVAIPTATTRRTLESTDAGRDLVICKDADDMFRKLGI
jgi:DNA-damage-inducible protein J